MNGPDRPPPDPADPVPKMSGIAPEDPALVGAWERLHPLSAVVRAGRGTLAILVVLLVSALGGGNQTGDVFRLAVVGVALVAGLVSWLVTRWRVADGVLQVETGLVRRSSARYPLTQIQAIDVVRPGLARVLGVAELRLPMAGARGSSGKLAYLANGHADVLRAQLLAMARGLEPAIPGPSPRQDILYTVDPGLLVASLLLTGPALVVEAAVVALVVLAVAAPAVAAGALSGSAAVLFGVLGVAWQRFNGEFRLTVADAPDGLRVQAGLVETSAETIPPGRIQALRLLQPLGWRAFGWCRVEVDLAGRSTSGRQNRGAKRAGRALLPVGSMAQAAWLVERVMPGVPAGRHLPPPPARWKSPLRYRHLSYAANDRYAVTTSGRLRLATDWVPLDKVQSIRRVQGPLQRPLRLASIHLDTAGRSVYAVLRDRGEAEAEELLASLPTACRRARGRAAGAGAGGTSRAPWSGLLGPTAE